MVIYLSQTEFFIKLKKFTNFKSSINGMNSPIKKILRTGFIQILVFIILKFMIESCKSLEQSCPLFSYTFNYQNNICLSANHIQDSEEFNQLSSLKGRYRRSSECQRKKLDDMKDALDQFFKNVNLLRGNNCNPEFYKENMECINWLMMIDCSIRQMRIAFITKFTNCRPSVSELILLQNAIKKLIENYNTTVIAIMPRNNLTDLGTNHTENPTGLNSDATSNLNDLKIIDNDMNELMEDVNMIIESFKLQTKSLCILNIVNGKISEVTKSFSDPLHIDLSELSDLVRRAYISETLYRTNKTLIVDNLVKFAKSLNKTKNREVCETLFNEIRNANRQNEFEILILYKNVCDMGFGDLKEKIKGCVQDANKKMANEISKKNFKSISEFASIYTEVFSANLCDLMEIIFIQLRGVSKYSATIAVLQKKVVMFVKTLPKEIWAKAFECYLNHMQPFKFGPGLLYVAREVNEMDEKSQRKFDKLIPDFVRNVMHRNGSAICTIKSCRYDKYLTYQLAEKEKKPVLICGSTPTSQIDFFVMNYNKNEDYFQITTYNTNKVQYLYFIENVNYIPMLWKGTYKKGNKWILIPTENKSFFIKNKDGESSKQYLCATEPIIKTVRGNYYLLYKDLNIKFDYKDIEDTRMVQSCFIDDALAEWYINCYNFLH